MFSELKEKLKKAIKMCQDAKMITINESEIPRIKMPIDPDILTKYKFSHEVFKLEVKMLPAILIRRRSSGDSTITTIN